MVLDFDSLHLKKRKPHGPGGSRFFFPFLSFVPSASVFFRRESFGGDFVAVRGPWSVMSRLRRLFLFVLSA